MKYLKTILWLIPILSFVLAVVSLIYLPDTIPIQVDISGNYSNFGSKYMVLIPPVICMIIPISRSRPNGRYRNSNPWFLLLFEIALLGAEIFAISMGMNYR